VPEHLPELTDVEIELLCRLSEALTAQQSESPKPRSLNDALRHPQPLDGMSTKALAQGAIRRTASQLRRAADKDVTLLAAKGKLGTFATDSCRALHPALLKIVEDREIASAQAMRRRNLEWLQLASCLDTEPLRVGAYQAHAERFLASAARLMCQSFPWIDFQLELEENRIRTGKSRGILRDRFDDEDIDFMLVPRDAEQTVLETVYTYSFRVVGTEASLNRLKEHGVIPIKRLAGEKLLVGPPDSSSRQRLCELMRDVGVNLEDDSVDLIEEANPSLMRIRAESGQGLAVMSDEYSAVGGSSRDFPHLGLDAEDHDHPRTYTVKMGLLRQSGAVMPRHRAFDFVVEELMTRESERERAAAQD